MQDTAPDHLEAETFSPLGAAPLVWLDLAGPGAEARARLLAGRTQAIIIGADRRGDCPPVDPAPFDCLLTVAAEAAAPWVCVEPARFEARAAVIENAVRAAPIAAGVLAQVLRIGEALPLREALGVESFAFSTLLGGEEFRAWRKTGQPVAQPSPELPLLAVAREEGLVTITLPRPDTRNAMSAAMRDALFEALASVLDDPTRPDLLLRGEGTCFSVGGDLAEFGTATDLAQAHFIRTARSCAALLDELGGRAEVLLHGACIGAGIEIPAAAARRTVLPGAYFHLPELKMGLIPGAGGTATISRAIGRHRTCYMMLSARRIAAPAALGWGLISGIAAVP